MIILNSVYRSVDVINNKFDVLISALGYEERCVFIPQKISGNYENGICFRFSDRKKLSYDKNKRVFEALGFNFIGVKDNNKESIKNNVLTLKKNSNSEITVAVDISSMTRSLTAEIIYTLSNLVGSGIVVTLLYAPAKYKSPENKQETITKCDVVIPEYSGWTIFPELPANSVVGLGFEFGRALGALEYVDTSDAWLFKPTGEDPRFETKIEQVNRDLITLYGSSRYQEYKLDDPYDTFIRLRSLIERLKDISRVVIFPFGPKIFNALSLVIAEIYKPDISIWRVTSGEFATPINHKPSGKILHFTFEVNNE